MDFQTQESRPESPDRHLVVTSKMAARSGLGTRLVEGVRHTVYVTHSLHRPQQSGGWATGSSWVSQIDYYN